MNMPDNIKPKDDALRQVMRRRKERRPSMELPKEVEDRVMERICAPDKVKSEERRVKNSYVFSRYPIYRKVGMSPQRLIPI